MTVEGHVPVLDALYRRAGGQAAPAVVLLGSRCEGCATPFFPSSPCRNPDCPGGPMIDVEFAGAGRIWGFTRLRYPLMAPALNPVSGEPVSVGLVDLDAGLRLYGRILPSSRTLYVGAPVALVDAPVGIDEDGVERWSWAFALTGSPAGVDQ